MLFNIVEKLEFIHNLNFAHCDVKLDNFMLN